MTSRHCLDEIELARALTVGLEPAMQAHLAECESCQATWSAFENAIERARELPIDIPSTAHREEVRTALLASLRTKPSYTSRGTRLRWVTSVTAVAAVAAGVTIIIAMTRSGSVRRIPHLHGTVQSQPGAIVSWVSEPPDEIVRLRDGVIDVSVEPLRPGERFRVLVGDAEIEVRGTEFEVRARGDRLIGVRVVHGRVEVRPTASAAVVLGEGQKWRQAVAVTPSPPKATVPDVQPTVTKRERLHESVRSASPPPAHDAPTVATPNPEEVAYDEAWSAMRRSDFVGAARAFARVVAFSPTGGLAEDASYWRAVSLARVPRRADAIDAFHDFLDSSPHSPRQGEASAMLGWLLVDGGQLEEAKQRFDRAASDTSKTVRASGLAGLGVIAHKHR